ncbi:GGDEF domain-containing protein [Thalassolituus hydrocarboniclasticus]|uniref:diguanylate cyclase n=1 Tax=Thalassolituus hydrocarboniclasticus TaxID=2742796 RepID=A0ABY6A8B3_9GAMM|nr:diguanylate cyclase [Thalassolituus hydrocarboniclasticus]UXD87028.1 GGDEF domain-containing protein [Thalassolituus hydrocarboniclasticus]
MPNISSQQDSDTLKRVEEQINILSGILDQGRHHLRFPGRLEQRYLKFRNQRFLEIDQKIIIGGLLFYLGFSWSDFYLGGDNARLIFISRLLIAVVMFALLWSVPRTRFATHMMTVAAAGIFIVGLSVLFFIQLIPDALQYAYHLGLVPIQVFTLVALRLSYRLMLIVSIALISCYVMMLLMFEAPALSPELSAIVNAFMPLFVLFWLLLICMGGYLSYAIESSARSDYMKNRLLALEAERLQYLTRRLHLLSTTDSLTGIANRRYLEECLDKEWRRCLRTQRPLALIMVDIDNFKDYNDYYGHQQGDHCLQSIARNMASFCQRPGDLCARYGGEEFIIILPDTTQGEAAYMAEKIRESIVALAIPHEASPPAVATISAGVVSMVPTAENSSDDLLRIADRMLYQAKEKGRNCVVAA